MKIVAIVGSPRANSNTGYLTDLALEEARKLGIETAKFVITDYKINPCVGHDECWDFTECPQKDDTESIIRSLYDADGIILACPVYYFNVTAQLKAFIDRNVFYRRHKWRMKARCAGLITVARNAGNEDTINALTRYITISSSITPEKIRQVTGIAKLAGEIKGNTAVMEQARRLGKEMASELLPK